MPSNRCVVQDCSNRSNAQAGTSMHYSPKAGGIRLKWIQFVRLHRANFEPVGVFPVCSEHFTQDCFQRKIHIPGQIRQINPQSIPSIWKKHENPVTKT